MSNENHTTENRTFHHLTEIQRGEIQARMSNLILQFANFVDGEAGLNL